MNGRFRTFTKITALAQRPVAMSGCVAVLGWLLVFPGLAVAAECGNGVVEDGEQCDDGNLDNGDCCSATCQFEALGSGCDDLDPCTTGDACDGAGTCVSGSPVTCPAPDQCHDGVCTQGIGCDAVPKQDGEPCDDGNPCTSDQCMGGVCTGALVGCGDGVLDPACEQCDDGNTDDGDCCSSTCQYEPPGSPCVDADFCTDHDTCDGAGVCLTGTPVTCTARDDCHDAGVCDPAYGCSNPRKPDGTPCDDGMSCSFGDQCIAGVCTGSVPTCGDGILESAGGCEQCDDGNTQGGDGCNANCRLELMGALCQGMIGQSGRLVSQGLSGIQGCRNKLNRGLPVYFDFLRTQPLTDPADCPNEAHASLKISNARRVTRVLVHALCSDSRVLGLGACADTVDGLINETADAGCLLETHAAGVNALIAQQYGPVSPGDLALTKCETAIGQSGASYALGRLGALQTCRNNLNRNIKLYFDRARQQRLRDPADCANEYRTYNRIVSLGKSAYKRLLGNPPRCTDAMVSSLGLCAATVNELISPDGTGGCLLAGHAAQVDTILDAEY